MFNSVSSSRIINQPVSKTSRLVRGARSLVSKAFAWAGLLALSWLTHFGQNVRAEDPELLVLRDMVRGNLGDAALHYIDARLRLAQDDEMRALWTMRRAETLAQIGLFSSQSDKYEEAAEVCEVFVSDSSNRRRIPWMKWQQARGKFLQAQSELAAYLAAPANKSRSENVLIAVREIVQQLESLDQDITRRLPIAARPASREVPLEAPIKQLHNLQVDASLLKCEALWLRVQTYAPESKDRIAAATLLTDSAQAVLDRTDATWPNREQLLTIHAAGQLQLAASEKGLATLLRLSREGATERTRSECARLAISHLCSSGMPSRARALLPRIPDRQATRLLAEAEIRLAELADAPDDSREDRLREIVSLGRSVRQRFGDYWGNRADALLAGRSLGGGTTVAPTSTATYLLEVEAKQLLAAGKRAEAIGVLAKGVEQETASGNSGSALRLAERAATLTAAEQDHIAAAKLLAETAIQFARSPEAAQKHALAVAFALRGLQTGPIEEVAVVAEQLMIEQLETWPNKQASTPVVDWLRQLMFAQDRSDEFFAAVWKKALAASAVQGPENDNNDDAENIVAQDLVTWMDAFCSLPPAKRSAAVDAAAKLTGGTGASATFEATLAIAELLAGWPDDRRRVELFRTAAKTFAHFRSANTFVQTMIGLTEAVRRLEGIRDGDLRGFRQIKLSDASSQTVAMTQATAAAMVEAIALRPVSERVAWAKAVELTSDSAAALKDVPGPASIAAGCRIAGWLVNPQTALEQLTELRKEFPRDATLILHLSGVAAEIGEEQLDVSDKLASVLIQNTQPNSSLHLKGRWQRLLNQLARGDTAGAKQEAEYFLAVSPPKDTVWLRRFESVAK